MSKTLAISHITTAREVQNLKKIQFSQPPCFSDGIASATQNLQNYTPSTPKLISPTEKSKPQAHYMWRVLQFVESSDKLEKDLMNLTIDEQHDLVLELSKLAKEELEKAHEAEKAGQSVSNWSYLSKIASCLFAAASMVIGWYLTGNPDVSNWVSYGMVGAGALSITSMALAEMDIWPDLMRVMGLGASTLGLVLGGGASFAFVAAQLPDLMVKITMLGVNALYGMSTVGRSYRKSQLQWYMHEQFMARQSRRQIENTTAENAQELEHTIDRMEHINACAFRLLDEEDRMRRQMQRIAKSAA